VADLESAFPAEPPSQRRFRLLAGAAALVVAASVGAGAQAMLARDRSPQPQRSAPLQAVAGAGGGTVSMLEASGRTSMTISTHDLPAAHDGQFYYAWLLDPTTNKMLPLGQVGPSGTASFEVSDQLLAAYSAVDVSLEDDDGDPQHSPTSVLRATYA
jgi:anti-sigma-K factor RskA